MEHLSGYPGYHSLRPSELQTFRVTYNDGTSYVTSMAIGITLQQARNYFFGVSTVVHEDENTGREVRKTVVAVEEAD